MNIPLHDVILRAMDDAESNEDHHLYDAIYEANQEDRLLPIDTAYLDYFRFAIADKVNH
jgi:hypothetical protein